MKLHAVRDTVDGDQTNDATSQQKRGRHECSAQRATGMEPAMAAKDGRDIPLKLGWPPARQAAPDLEDHCNLKKAAAACCGHASRCKNLRHQQ
jgi:hypothetical protein